jgi:RimJ/RimL family protein N-acetyltransferase
MNFNDLELMQMHIDVLYIHDANNRLMRINESDAEDPPPRLYLGRTLAGKIWRVRYDLPNDLTEELERLAAAEPIVQDLHEPPYYLDQYKELLQQHAPLHNTDGGPAYYLPELNLPTGTVTITPENKTLLQANFPYTLSTLDERSPVVAVANDGAVVAACYTARSIPLAAEAGVYTEEHFRGRGYAVEIVRGWAAATRAIGKLPLYSTSWDNTASQAVAAKLGALLYGVDFSIT